MANNLHFEYSLSVNEKQTQQNLATFIKKTFGTDKNAKLAVPIKLDITTNLTNVDLKSIQDQLDKQFKGKLTLNATVKVDASNVARQAQNELDKISKSLSLKVGLEVDPSAMKLMLGTIDVIKTLNKEVTKVKDNLKDLGKKIEININGAQINQIYDGALKTAEKIQQVNERTTEEINEQLKISKEKLAYQQKIADEKKKELELEKDKQQVNKEIEKTNKKIREQQSQLNKEVKGIESQIKAEKEKAKQLDKQNKTLQNNAKVQADATEKMEKSTKKIAELEKQRADNQAFLNSKKEEEKALITNIELGKQEISLLKEKIKEMEKLKRTVQTVTTVTGGTTTKQTTTSKPRKPTKKKTSGENVVKVDTPTSQAVQQAVQPVQARADAEQKLTDVVKQESVKREKAIQSEIKAQNQLAENTEKVTKQIDGSLYRAQDSKREIRKANGRDKLYNNLIGSDFASSLSGYRIHDVTSIEQQKEYQEFLLDVLIKSRGVLKDFNFEMQEGVALSEEQVKSFTALLETLNAEKAIALSYRGAKDKSDGKFLDKYKEWEQDNTNKKLGSELDFQAEKESKLGATREYVKALDEQILKIEQAIGAQIRNNSDAEKDILKTEMEAFEKAKKKAINSAKKYSKQELDEIIYKDAKTEFKGLDDMDFDRLLDVIYVQAEKLKGMANKIKVNFIEGYRVDLDELNAYFAKVEKSIVELQQQAEKADDPTLLNKKIESRKKNIAGLKEQVNLLFTLQSLEDVKHVEKEYAAKFQEKFGSRVSDIDNGTLKSIANPKLVNAIKANVENFKDFVEYTHALNNQTHETRGGVFGLLDAFEKLKKSKDASGEDWDNLAEKLKKYLDILGKTQEEVDKEAEAGRQADKARQAKEDARKAEIKHGKEYVKQLREAMKELDKESDLCKECTKAINIFQQAIKNNVEDDDLNDYILKLQELNNALNGKDGGNFKESNSKVKIAKQQSKEVDDVNVKYEKQAQALSKILDLQKKGEKVSLNIDKLIDSQGRGWKEVAQEQEKLYRKTNDNMLWFQVSHLDMNDTYFSGSDNLFEPTKYFDFSQKADDRESIIKFLSEYTAKMHILEELQEKMSNYVAMPNARKQDISITDAATKAKLKEADAYDAVLAKQKEAEKNDKIHAEWLRNKEIAIAKEPYLKASKELLSRMRGSAQYKNHKDDIKFMESFKNTQNYIDALKNGNFTLEQTVDAFKNLSIYAQDTFHMKPTTVEKIANKYLEAAQVAEVVTQETQEVVEKNEKVAETVNKTTNATKEKAQAEQSVTEELKQQANVAENVKVETQNVAKETENKLKAEQKISEELRKQVVLTDKLTPTQAEKAYEMIFEHLSKGGKLSTSFMNSLTNAMDEIKLTDYGSALGKRGALVSQGRKKKDGVFYNRTDEYKKLKEDADKVVSEAQKPLFDVYKMIAKNIKDAGKETEKSVKKAKADSSTAKAVNKTKKEQNQIVQEQAKAENKSIQRQGNLLQVAQDILQANKEGRQYTLDINNLLDDQGRTWQDIAKNSEKVYKNVKDANILYTSFENMDMNRVYGNDDQSNGIFTPTNYIDNEKYNKAKTDAERIALMSEYDGKFGILSQLESKFKDLLIAEDTVNEKEEYRLKVAREILEAERDGKKYMIDINNLTDEQGRTWKQLANEIAKTYKNMSENTIQMAYENIGMHRNVYNGNEVQDIYNAARYIDNDKFDNAKTKSAIIDAMSEFNAKTVILNSMSDIVKELMFPTEKVTQEVQQQATQAKKDDANTTKQATDVIAQLRSEINSLEDELKGISVSSLDEVNKKIKAIQNDPNYKIDNETIRKIAKANLTAGGRPHTEQSIMQAMFKLIEGLKMDDIYDEGLKGAGKQDKEGLYGLKDAKKYLELDGKISELMVKKHNIESAADRRSELEQEIKAKKEQLALAEKENNVKKEQAKIETKTTENKQKQVTVQKQVVQGKQEEFKSSKAEAEVVQKTLTLEEKKNKIIANMKMNETDMRSDDEIQYLKDEIAKIDEKTASLKAQGETLKFLNTLKIAGATKQASRLAADIMMGKENASDFGIDDKTKFANEQLEINSLAIDRADMQHKLDLQQQLIEENKAYQEELDKLNGVVKKKVEVQKEEIEVSDKLSDSSTKGLSDLKAKLEVEEQVAKTSEKTAESMKQTAKVAEYSDRRTEVYNDTIQNFLNKAKKLKDSYIGDEELARMEEEKNLLKDKLVLLQKQGETGKMLINIAQRVEKGEGSFQELQSLAFVAPDRFGVENLEQFEKEQKEIHKLQKELGDLTYKIRDEREKPEDAQKYLEMASKEQKALREYIAEKTGANKADAVGLKQSKEQVEVIRELIVGLNDANRAIAGDGLSDLGLAKLETIMQLYQGTDGLSHASFGGLGGKYSSIIKDYDYDEEKILNRMATDLPWDLMKYHDLYPKLEKWYKELAELAKLGDSPEYQNLNKKVQSLQKTILGLIEDIIYNLVEQPIAKVDLWDSEMIHKSMYDYHKEYGLQEVDSSKEEGDAEATALEESVKSSMRAIADAKQSWGAIKQEVKDVAVATQEVVQDTQEIATQTQQVEESMEDTVQATKEEAKVIKEPIEDFKTLEEYQHRYRKSPRGATEETFDSEAHLTVNHPKFSNESIGHLEAMMEMFYTKDGGVMPSYKGMALPKEVIESLGVEKLNSLLAEYAIRFHKEFQKYVQDSYVRMSYAKDLAEKGESIGDDHYFQKMTNAMEEFKAKLVNDAMKLIADISKSEDSVFYSNEKYDDLADYWLMEGGKGHDVSMEDRDVWNNASSQIEYLTDQEKQLQDVIQSQLTTKKQIADTTKQEKQDVKDVVEVKQEEKKVIQETNKELEEERAANVDVLYQVNKVNESIEDGTRNWKDTYQYLKRVVDASTELAKTYDYVKDEWAELKDEADLSETNEQWKEMADRVKEFGEELGINFSTEKGLYDARKQALKDIDILSESPSKVVGQIVSGKYIADAKESIMLDNALGDSEEKLADATEKVAKAKTKEAKATKEASDAKKKDAKSTDKSTKAKKAESKATQEMITITKDATLDDYRKAAFDAIKKVGSSKTFKTKASKDATLLPMLQDLDKETKINRSSGTLGIDYWADVIKRLKEITSKAGMKDTTVDNAIIPHIGGSIAKSKATNQVKALAGIDTTSAKKVEKSTQETAKATEKMATAATTVKNETQQVEKAIEEVKQDVVDTTDNLGDLAGLKLTDLTNLGGTDAMLAMFNDMKQNPALFGTTAEELDKYIGLFSDPTVAKNFNAELDAMKEQETVVEEVVEQKKEEKEIIQEIKQETKETVQEEKEKADVVQETKEVQQQVVEQKKEEKEIVGDIVQEQKQVVVVSQQVQEISEEELQAMKDELATRQKIGAEQNAKLKIVRQEIKEAKALDKSLEKSIAQENKVVNAMKEKLATAQENERIAKQENEERLKQKAEMEAHIKLLEQQAEEKRQAITLLESEVQLTEDNTFQVKQLTKEYDKLQDEIKETQQEIDDLTDAYYEQAEQARKANNEASQKMIDSYMEQLEKQAEERRKEQAKYLPAISGEVGEYKGDGGGGSVPPSGGGNSPDPDGIDFNDRIKLRQRELMLQLQQIVHNKELNDEQKLGTQILAEQIVEIGQIATNMKELNWLTQNVRENMKEFKFSIKVDQDNKKELARIAEEERKELTNMYASMFDEIDANEKLKAEAKQLEEVIALYKQKTLAEVDAYGAKNSGYADTDRLADLRTMITYMEQNITSAGEYENTIRQIGNIFREIKFDTNQTKQWYKMEESAEKARVAQEKQAKAQEELSAKVAKHIQVKKEQARLYEKEIMSSKTMRNATEQERMKMETLIRTYEIKGNTIQEVNQSYAQMQRLVKDMRLDVMNKQLMEQDTWLDRVKNGIKDYVRFTLDLDDIQGVMQNVTRLFSASFEHIKVLDEAYTNVNQTMKVTQEEFNGMRDIAYEVANANGALGTDILEMVKIYAGAGVEIEEVNSKLAGTVAFQNISGLSGTDATNAIQTIVNQFKLTTEKGYEAGDAIWYVGDAISGVAYNLSKDEGDAMREIISAVEDAGAVIESAGGSLEWYSALTGTLAETMNATGSEVGGAMRMITARTLQQKEAFEELNDSGEETEVAMANAEKALTNLGISIRGSDGDLRSIEEVLGEVAAKWDSLSDSDQQFVAEKLAGTNRRTYFMSLMENYERVIELQEKSMTSEGMMMEASEKYAESLTGKLNGLTNAQEKFYQSLMNSTTMKSWIDFGTDSLNMITKIVQAMEGKWIPAIVGVTGALITFKKVMSGLSWEQFLSNCVLAVAKMMGVAEGANIATVALQAFKAGLKGIVVGAVIAGIVYLIQSFESLDERTAKATDALNNYISVMNDTEGHVQAVEMMDLKIKKINNQNTSLENQQQLIKEVNDELSKHGEAYGDIKSILDNENLSLEYRLELLDQEISKRREAAELAARDAFDDTDWGNDVYKAQGNVVTDATDRMKQGYDDVNFTGGDTEQFEKSWIEVTTEINNAYQEGVKQFNEIRKAYAQELISSEEYQQAYEDFIAFETSIAEQVASVEEYTGRTVEFATQSFADIHTEATTAMTQSQQDYIKNLSELEQSQQLLDSMLNDGIQSSELTELLENDIFSDFRGDITKTSDVVDYLDNKVKNLQNSIDSFDASNVNDTSTGDFDTSGLNSTTQTIQEANKAYIEQLNIIENIQAMLDDIDENGYTLEVATEAIDSGLLDDYIGSVEDGIGVQEHLNNKIYEAQEIANQAYYNMMKDDENFWAQKMANSENWRAHEQQVQNDIIALTAKALGIQETDFANFINSKGGFRQIDYSNCKTMAQAENSLQANLMNQISGYMAQMVNSKAGNRQTDMSNIVQFLNTQGVKEAQTVQELMDLWAKFYNAKAKAIQAEINDYNRRTQELINMETQLGEEAWLEDGALKHGLLNAIQAQSQLKLDNVAMTNYFAGLTAGFSGVGGGVGQSYVSGGVGGGGLSSAKPSTSTAKPSGSSGGSTGKPSSGSGGSGSGSGSSEQEVEDMELEIDRYYKLNDAITDVENAIAKLQAQREKITTKSAYKKSMQKEIDLINQQITALKNLNKEQTKEKNEIKSTLSKNGFKFDSEGDITNYASRLKTLQDNANKKTGAKKESAIAQVEHLVELIERYTELNDDAIPSTNIQIIELQNEIANLNKELEENTKTVEYLGDVYFNVSRKIASLDNALALNNLLQENAEEERKIELMKEEQKLLEQKQKALKSQKSLAQNEASEIAKELKSMGVKFGNQGNIVHYDELMKNLTIKADSLVGTAREDEIAEVEEMLDLIDKYLELTESTIPELEQSWQEYANTIEDINEEIEEMYHAHQEQAVQTQKDIASAYEHYLNERYDKVKKALQEEQDLYNKAYSEENYQRELKEQQRALDEIAQQIAIYSRDTSQAGMLKLQQLKEEYAEQQEAINDMIRENEKSLVDERFEEEQEALDKELELLTSPEHLVQVVNDAIGSGLITIGDQVLSLSDVMSSWLDETGDGLYALGGELKTELIDNLQNAKDILGEMGMLNGSMSLASSQALLSSISGTGVLGGNVTFNAPLMTIEGNVDPTVMPELKQELAKLEQTILTKIAKSMK